MMSSWNSAENAVQDYVNGMTMSSDDDGRWTTSVKAMKGGSDAVHYCLLVEALV